MSHCLSLHGFSVPSGYLVSVGGSYAGICSCWSGTSPSDWSVSVKTENFADNRIREWNECFHSYLDGSLYERSPNYINVNDVITVYGGTATVIARYSSGLVYACQTHSWGNPINPVYGVYEYSGYWARWGLVASVYPGGTTTGTFYGGNYTNTANSGSGNASFSYSDDRSPEPMAKASITYVGNDNFAVDGYGASVSNGIIQGIYIGDITVLNIKCMSQDQAEIAIFPWTNALGILDNKYIFENRKSVQLNAIDCIMQADYFDLNMIAFLKDFKEFKDTLKSLRELLKGKVNLKNVASLHLVKKYVVETTARDIDDIISKAPVIAAALRSHQNQVKPQRFHTRSNSNFEIHVGQLSGIYEPDIDMHESTVCTLHLSPRIETCPISRFLHELDKFDALPTLENLWDLVPYSFVVDWFIGYGDNLIAISADRKTRYYDLCSHIYSQKDVCTLTATGQFSGTVRYENYKRFVSFSWPGFNFELNFSLPFTHFIELGALAVQKI